MEKRTEDFIKATEKFISCFKPEKLEAARGWAGMYLVNYGGSNEFSCYRAKIMIDALREKGEYDDSIIEG